MWKFNKTIKNWLTNDANYQQQLWKILEKIANFGWQKKTRNSDPLTSEFHSGCKKWTKEPLNLKMLLYSKCHISLSGLFEISSWKNFYFFIFMSKRFQNHLNKLGNTCNHSHFWHDPGSNNLLLYVNISDWPQKYVRGVENLTSRI